MVKGNKIEIDFEMFEGLTVEKAMKFNKECGVYFECNNGQPTHIIVDWSE